ncbi:MAG: sigma-70 family RNA polymerase sigma factor [Chloroflexota bacterium]
MRQDLTALSDSILMDRLAGGDEVSFDTLFYRHYDRVYGILFRLVGTRAEAEDLTQEVFLKLHDHAARHRSHGDDNISAWLYRVATNLGYNAIRNRQRRWQRDVVLVPDSEMPGAEQEVARRQEVAAVREALARMKARDAQLLILRQMDFSYAECAAICGVAPGSVGTLLARAAESFRTAYVEVAGRGEER